MSRVVISDASPLHYLILIGNAELLQALYTEVLIPEAVAKELQQAGTPESVRHWIVHAPRWLHVVPFTASPLLYYLPTWIRANTLAYYFSQRVPKTKVLVVIGYSFGDAYVNQIIEQGVRRNGNLRIVVVSPFAAERVREQPFLDRSPRVIPLAETAEQALTKRSLRDHVPHARFWTISDSLPVRLHWRLPLSRNFLSPSNNGSASDN